MTRSARNQRGIANPLLWIAASAALHLSCSATNDPKAATPSAKSTNKSRAQVIDASPGLEASEKNAPSDASDSPATGPIPRLSQQLIVTVTDGWKATNAVLSRFEREAGGPWQQVDADFDTRVGYAGLAWGRGLHNISAPAGEPKKVEGDGKSPAGVFAVGALYGYDKAFSGKTKLPYQQVDRQWRCVDDSNSKYYNRVLSQEGVDKDWTEAEEMRRSDSLYKLVIAIDHNGILSGTPVPEGGSCIFFHVWRAKRPTIGCTSMPLSQMTALASWLDPKLHPTLVALPKQSYEALATRWALPDLAP